MSIIFTNVNRMNSLISNLFRIGIVGVIGNPCMIPFCRFWKKEYDDWFSTWYLSGHFCIFRRWHICQKIIRSTSAVDRAANQRYENSTIFQWCTIRMGNYEHESNPFPFLQPSGLIWQSLGYTCTSLYIFVHLCISLYIFVHFCTSLYIFVHLCKSWNSALHKSWWWSSYSI